MVLARVCDNSMDIYNSSDNGCQGRPGYSHLVGRCGQECGGSGLADATRRRAECNYCELAYCIRGRDAQTKLSTKQIRSELSRTVCC